MAAGYSKSTPTIPKGKTNGNTKPDQAWIAEMLKDGSLREADQTTKPKNFYWDVLYQWDGDNDEVNPDFFEVFRLPQRANPPRKCTGTAYIRDHRGGYVADVNWKRLTRQCIGRPAVGMTVCHVHGAEVPIVRAAAQRRLAEASEIVAERLIGLTGTEDENGNMIEHKDRISASNSVLDRAGIKGGMEVEITTPGFKRVLDGMFTDDSSAEN